MPVVCQYFLANCCRYGNRCRNLHTYEPQQSEFNNKTKPSGVSVLQRDRYVYHAPKEDPKLSKNFADLQKEINASLTMWPFSCYSFLTECGNIEGFEDVSPEELRLKAYEALKNNDFQAFEAATSNMKKNVAELRKNFLQKTEFAQRVFSIYLKNETQQAEEMAQSRSPSAFNTTGFFSSVPQNNNSFTLSSHPSFRGQSQSAAFQKNIFGQALSESGNNFSFNTVPSQPPFGGDSMFEQTSQPFAEQKTSVFGEPVQGSSLFRQNIFGSAIQSKPSAESMITAAQASQSSSQFSFGNVNTNSATSDKVTGKVLLYSLKENLSAEELEQFQATTFTYGKTPLKCPPKELC